MLLKKAARLVLHQMGGLAALRFGHRREFGVVMFHRFGESERANMEAICSHIARHFEPVSLDDILDALDGVKSLPDNAVTVTVDDGYRDFLTHGYPIFRRHGIPVTLYAVAGFCDRRLWLWPDQIEFGLSHTARSSIRALPGDDSMELTLGTAEEKADSIFRLTYALKAVPNERRLAFMQDFGRLCEVDIPAGAPEGFEAMSWDELRAVAADGAGIGCHTETHPILSRLASRRELEREIRGAKEHMAERLGFEVRHFCYPNGRPMDIGEDAVQCVKEAGFVSAVSCTWGLNTPAADRFLMRRVPLDSTFSLQWGSELLAGLHM